MANSKIPKPPFAKTLLLLILSFGVPTFLFSDNVFDSPDDKPRIRGDQFLTGSAAVDAVSYTKFLLSEHEGIDVDARWFPATLLIRPTDANGITLSGPSGKGYQEGSIMRYKLGWSLNQKYISYFFAMDYYVASHIGNFFTLWNPFAGLAAPFTGAKETGFAAKAGQVMPGIELKIPKYKMALRLGYLFKFRDPIDESGLFLSQYTGDMGGYFGRYDRGDYGLDGANNIPEGVSGFNKSEPYVSLIYDKTELNSLFSSGSFAFFELNHTFKLEIPVLESVSPSLSYVAENYHIFGERNITRFSPEVVLKFGPVKVKPYLDQGISPFQLYQFRTALNVKGVELGGSTINVANTNGGYDRHIGFRAGYLGTIVDVFQIGFLVSKNYSDILNADIISLNALMYEFKLRLKIKATPDKSTK